MSTVAPHRPLDAAVIAARDREDLVIGNEIVRHNRASRLIHWTVAVTFLICLLTGMPIWTPVFGWMAHLFGGLSVCRVIHPWAGVAFFIAAAVMFVQWVSDMRLEPDEKDWLGPKMLEYMRFSGEDPNVGKYNGGQKLFFYAVLLDAFLVLLTGIVLWFPASFGAGLREASILLHDIGFIAFAVAIVGHVYLGTAAEPGTFSAMTRGTVSKAWARLHHPKWYREVTGEEPRR